MLHFNGSKSKEISGGAATADASSEAPAWKVLVMDSVAQEILSPVMKVNDLRDNGVTLYLYGCGGRALILKTAAE